MERTQIFDLMGELKLYGMKAVANHLQVSGDGVARFSRLIGAGLATFDVYMRNGPIVLYRVGLTEKGLQLIQAWQSGNRQTLASLMGVSHARPRGCRINSLGKSTLSSCRPSLLRGR
jgi:hypothetical protein